MMAYGLALTLALATGAMAQDAPKTDAKAPVKSGLAVGAAIGAFDVVKCGGAAEDGVEVGKQLCYRCRYGGRPQVMVFTRSIGGEIDRLASQLNTAVKSNSAQKLAAFVNLLGKDRENLERNAKDMAKKQDLTMVPVVVPVEFENGPANYGISPDADVTVILAVDGRVAASHAYSENGLNAEGVRAIIADLNKILPRD